MMYARKFGAAMVVASLLFVGCDKEASTTKTTEVKTPDGKTTTTETHKVETSGTPPATGTGS